jgi:hypothetical protein
MQQIGGNSSAGDYGLEEMYKNFSAPTGQRISQSTSCKDHLIWEEKSWKPPTARLYEFFTAGNEEVPDGINGGIASPDIYSLEVQVDGIAMTQSVIASLTFLCFQLIGPEKLSLTDPNHFIEYVAGLLQSSYLLLRNDGNRLNHLHHLSSFQEVINKEYVEKSRRYSHHPHRPSVIGMAFWSFLDKIKPGVKIQDRRCHCS